MVMFPSDEWAKAVAGTINNSTEYAEAAKAWEGDICIVVTPEGALKEPVYVYLDLWHGKAREAYVLRDPGTKKASFIISAPLSTWRRMMEGKLNPFPAFARRQLKVEGNWIKLIGAGRGGQLAFECAVHTPAEFPE
jgi:putative sterol carrier protein